MEYTFTELDRTLKPKNLKKPKKTKNLKKLYKNVGFYKPWLQLMLGAL